MDIKEEPVDALSVTDIDIKHDSPCAIIEDEIDIKEEPLESIEESECNFKMSNSNPLNSNLSYSKVC